MIPLGGGWGAMLRGCSLPEMLAWLAALCARMIFVFFLDPVLRAGVGCAILSLQNVGRDNRLAEDKGSQSGPSIPHPANPVHPVQNSFAFSCLGWISKRLRILKWEPTGRRPRS